MHLESPRSSCPSQAVRAILGIVCFSDRLSTPWVSLVGAVEGDANSIVHTASTQQNAVNRVIVLACRHKQMHLGLQLHGLIYLTCPRKDSGKFVALVTFSGQEPAVLNHSLLLSTFWKQ